VAVFRTIGKRLYKNKAKIAVTGSKGERNSFIPTEKRTSKLEIILKKTCMPEVMVAVSNASKWETRGLNLSNDGRKRVLLTLDFETTFLYLCGLPGRKTRKIAKTILLKTHQQGRRYPRYRCSSLTSPQKSQPGTSGELIAG
jgi:hypothetical protein